MIQWKPLRQAVATQANRKLASRIKTRLLAAKLAVWQYEGRTHQGTRYVRVLVDTQAYDTAYKEVEDLLPARPVD